MTKQEQINKMTKLISDAWLVDLDGYTIDVYEVLDEVDIKGIAREPYGKGCRIVPDDAVVLTKEEYESLRQSLTQTTNRECELADRARALLHECDVLKVDLEKARKETAREFAEKIKEKYGHYWCYLYKKDLKQLRAIIDELLKEYEK